MQSRIANGTAPVSKVLPVAQQAEPPHHGGTWIFLYLWQISFSAQFHVFRSERAWIMAEVHRLMWLTAVK
ncbi:hypothetical protein TUM17575_43790 [Klebsiella pneumoniae]|nr:hypothetical protein TUM17573_54590 [Klebsiella pneumoniae]GJL31790.1 hypothetical protein TUM17575_43790 [Klebsiella pneumoniae]